MRLRRLQRTRRRLYWRAPQGKRGTLGLTCKRVFDQHTPVRHAYGAISDKYLGNRISGPISRPATCLSRGPARGPTTVGKSNLCVVGQKFLRLRRAL